MPVVVRLLRRDPAKGIEINVIGRSPHVVAYRMWLKKPGETVWTKIGEGHTADNKPDFLTVAPAGDDTELDYALSIGGNANTTYRAIVTFAQDGKVLEDGTNLHTGKTDGVGFASDASRVKFIS